MRIIFVTREGYNLAGARVRCYNFSRELKNLGIDTAVLSFRDDLGAKDGPEERCLRLRDKWALNYRAFQRLSKEKDAILCIQRFNYHSLAPYLSSLVRKNRIILDLDDWEMREDHKYHLGFYPSSKAHYLTCQIARRSIFCIAASRFLERFLRDYNKDVCYIPTGVDTKLFNNDFFAQNESDVVFSWVGTFNKKESIDSIKFTIDCFCSLRKSCNRVYLHIVGDGIYLNEIEGLVSLSGDQNIQLKYWLAPHKVPQYLSSVQVGLLPLVNDTKFNRAKSPTKLFEYMAMGKPTVCGKIGEASNIIKDGKNGFLAQSKEEYISKMKKLIASPELRKNIGLKARETVESEYSLKVLGLRLYSKLKQHNA